jgi:hypothetical protein
MLGILAERLGDLVAARDDGLGPTSLTITSNCFWLASVSAADAEVAIETMCP